MASKKCETCNSNNIEYCGRKRAFFFCKDCNHLNITNGGTTRTIQLDGPAQWKDIVAKIDAGISTEEIFRELILGRQESAATQDTTPTAPAPDTTPTAPAPDTTAPAPDTAAPARRGKPRLGPEVNYGYPTEVKVVELSEKGRPMKIEIACSTDGCNNKRIIKVQDYFQVKRCNTCQAEYLKEYRKELAKVRRQRKSTTKKQQADTQSQQAAAVEEQRRQENAQNVGKTTCMRPNNWYSNKCNEQCGHWLSCENTGRGRDVQQTG